MNEPIAAVMVGLLLCLSAGVRVTLPLLAVNLLALYHQITLPHDLAWLGTGPTLIILGVACAAETVVHFIPAAGTWLKALATPLAFAAGTLLMAIPLSDHNPLMQWTLAAATGGGLATLMHVGVTGARVITAPANVASLGLFGLIWNLAEFLIAGVLALVGVLWLVAGWAIGLLALLALAAFVLIFISKVFRSWNPDAPALAVSSRG